MLDHLTAFIGGERLFNKSTQQVGVGMSGLGHRSTFLNIRRLRRTLPGGSQCSAFDWWAWTSRASTPRSLPRCTVSCCLQVSQLLNLSRTCGLSRSAEYSSPVFRSACPGRMGHPKALVYLSNPVVAAASAVAGEIIHPAEIMKREPAGVPASAPESPAKTSAPTAPCAGRG